MDILNGKVFFGVTINTDVVKEQSFVSDEVTALRINASYHSVELVATGNKDFRVVQLGRDTIDEDELFTAETRDGILSVGFDPSVRYSFTIGINIASDKLIIEVPSDWLGDVTAHSASGSVKATSDFTWRNAELTSKSGSVRTQSLSCDALNMSSTSGSVKTEGTVNVSGKLSMSSVSGSVHLLSNASAGEITMSSKSGSVKAEGFVKSLGSLSMSSISGSVRVYLAECASYTLESTSGSVTAEGITGGGKLSSKSGSVTAVLVSPVGDVTASSISGSVKLTVPGDTAFHFEGRSTSGSVKSDFEILFKDSNKKTAVCDNGFEPRVSITASSTSGSVKLFRN